jgi:type IV secretory pathway TraG/TraD family ATPase VirD4
VYSETAPKVGALAVAALKATLPLVDQEHRAKSNDPLPLGSKQLFYVFDEWSVFAGDHVVNIVNMGRSYGGSACLAFQSFADFLIDGRDQLLRQVAGSVGTFVVHGLNDPQDAEYAASLFGTQDSIEYTAQTLNGSPTGAESARATKEFAVHPDDLKNLAVGEAFVMNKTERDKKTNRSIARLIKVRKTHF